MSLQAVGVSFSAALLPPSPPLSVSLSLPPTAKLAVSFMLPGFTHMHREGRVRVLATHEGAPAILNHTGLDSGYLYTSCRLYLRNRGREKSELTFLSLEFFKSICRLRRVRD